MLNVRSNTTEEKMATMEPENQRRAAYQPLEEVTTIFSRGERMKKERSMLCDSFFSYFIKEERDDTYLEKEMFMQLLRWNER